MTETRILELEKRLAEIEDACESCDPYNPPWGMIDDVFDIAHELLDDLAVVRG